MIAILGTDRAGTRLVKHLQKYNVDCIYITASLHDVNFMKKIKNRKIIHFIGSPTVTLHGILTLIRFKIWRKKIFVSWRGSDVFIANNKIQFKISSRLLQSLIDFNSALAPHLVKELNQIGVKALLQPIPTFSLFNIRSLPKEKKIAIYMPDKLSYQWNWFQGNWIKKIINDFPDVQFIITSNSGKDFLEKNVTCINWTENMEQVYEQVIAVIRLPLHDGLSNTILEATSMGREVIAFNVDFSFCNVIKNYNELRELLTDILKNPKLNIIGSKHVHQKYNKDIVTKQIIKIYDNMI